MSPSLDHRIHKLVLFLLSLVAIATNQSHAQNTTTMESLSPSPSLSDEMETMSFSLAATDTMIEEMTITVEIGSGFTMSSEFTSTPTEVTMATTPISSPSLSPSPSLTPSPFSSTEVIVTMTTMMMSSDLTEVTSATSDIMTQEISVAMTTDVMSQPPSSESSQPMSSPSPPDVTETPTTQPTTDPTSSGSSAPLATEAIIGIAAVGGILLAIVVISLFFFICCCFRRKRRSATYDATRGRPVYVVRRWDERTEHVPNRGGSFRGSKGSIARSSIRSSISSIASIVRSSLRRSRNNSLSRSGADTIANPQVIQVTPL